MKKSIFLLLLWLPMLMAAQKNRSLALLPAGTPIMLEAAEDITSAKVSVNDQIAFRVVGDVLAGQHIVIRDGATAWARVLGVHKATYNTLEHIRYELIAVTSADGQQITVYSSHVYAPAEYIGMTSWLRAGKKATAYVLEDVKIRMLK
jgi:hypothetical protein